MNQLKTIVITCMFICILGNVNAQYTGPGSKGKLFTIEYIKANASSLDKSDALIQIKGYVIELINKEDYWFKDSTGTILVEIEKNTMPIRPFDDKTEVIIVGEVDYDVLEGIEIEAEEILFTKP